MHDSSREPTVVFETSTGGYCGLFAELADSLASMATSGSFLRFRVTTLIASDSSMIEGRVPVSQSKLSGSKVSYPDSLDYPAGYFVLGYTILYPDKLSGYRS